MLTWSAASVVVFIQKVKEEGMPYISQKAETNPKLLLEKRGGGGHENPGE